MAPKRNKTEAIYRSRYITRQTRSQSHQRNNIEEENELDVPDEDEEAVRDEDEEAVRDEDEEAVPDEDEEAVPDEDEEAVPDEDEEAVHDEDEEAVRDEDEAVAAYYDVVEEAVLAAVQLPSSFDTPRSGGDDGYTSTSSPEIEENAEISVIDILDEETDSDEPRLGANDIVGSPISLSSRIDAFRSYSEASSSTSQSTRSNSTTRPHIWDMTVDLTSPRRSTIPPVTSRAHFAVTPPRTPTILNETVDLTDSPVASPGTDTPPTNTSASTAVSSPPKDTSLPPASSPSAASSPPVTSSDTTMGAPLIRCPVCLDDLPRIRFAQKTVMSTVCGHVFCSSCLPVCIQSTGRCPTCRRFLHFRDMHPIFI